MAAREAAAQRASAAEAAAAQQKEAAAALAAEAAARKRAEEQSRAKAEAVAALEERVLVRRPLDAHRRTPAALLRLSRTNATAAAAQFNLHTRTNTLRRPWRGSSGTRGA